MTFAIFWSKYSGKFALKQDTDIKHSSPCSSLHFTFFLSLEMQEILEVGDFIVIDCCLLLWEVSQLCLKSNCPSDIVIWPSDVVIRPSDVVIWPSDIVISDSVIRPSDMLLLLFRYRRITGESKCIVQH